MKCILVLMTLFLTITVFSQENTQSIAGDSVNVLQQIVVSPNKLNLDRMPETRDNVLYSGKKNEIITLSSIQANLTTNNAREVFSRVPGVSIWENDGSGIQINVGLRGLSPNRSWELNTRQNGYDISSDVFGYPEAYYNPPLEAVASIELVRGGASLQFGPQFGGMLNYKLKRETKKKFSFETQNTVGSYNLASSYNAIGGKAGKFSYYAYNHSRSADGWRDNGAYSVRNSHVFFGYDFSEKTNLSIEYTNMNYAMQQAGGLTDEQFKTNPQQSLRNRNWFGAPWNILALNFDTKINDKLSSNTKIFGLIGQRNSVGFTATPNVQDVIDPTTNDFANRRVDRDFYRNFGLENRNLFKYSIGKIDNNLAFGARLYRANTQRHQNGRGTTGADFDLAIVNRYARDLNFFTENIAFFAENQIKINPKFSVTPGIRYEYINSTGEGRFGINAGNDVPFEATEITRNQPLFGLGMEYKLRTTNLYANITQAYRPVLFSDLTPPAVTDEIDPNLRDASGFNADIGYRGAIKNYLNFDVSLFYLSYTNRIGGIRQFTNNDPAQGTFLFRTNLGETINMGLESFVNFDLSKFFKIDKFIGSLNAFATLSFIDSRYTDFPISTIQGDAPNEKITKDNLNGKRVENAPRYIHNFGLVWQKNSFCATLQYRLTSEIYTDANNTSTASTNGVTGALAAYNVMDMSTEYLFLKHYTMRAGINNLTNETYATRRASGYPGPGILPGEGRTFFISIGAKF